MKLAQLVLFQALLDSRSLLLNHFLSFDPFVLINRNHHADTTDSSLNTNCGILSANSESLQVCRPFVIEYKQTEHIFNTLPPQPTPEIPDKPASKLEFDVCI